ncbi:MAG: replication-associated recombination protein A [Rhodobacteraceae bacterium]|nr:replication-associated recombination protein A [Paracoccaceae bacterium]
MNALTPLADRLRPTALAEVVGQDHLFGDGGPIDAIRRSGKLPSLVLWGPPGVGKTTLARLLASCVDAECCQLSAAQTNAAELARCFSAARARRDQGQATVLFIDEIHAFNRTRQDSFLQHLEDGTIILIGATTENPSFELNTALLSRVRILVLNRLNADDLEKLMKRAEAATGGPLPLTEDSRARIIDLADGDGRALLNMIEQVAALPDGDAVRPDRLATLLARRAAGYDRSGEWHYNLISALHKSVRGSDPDAAIYWLARMLNGGEDPNYLARRITRIAIEDIGLADPEALTHCLNAWQTYERLGSPEGELALVQSVIYLALSPKSNATYRAMKRAVDAAAASGSLDPPKHILNAPTRLMQNLGYGQGYDYDHDSPDGVSGQRYFPDGVDPEPFYCPVERGFERTMFKRLQYFRRLRDRKAQDTPEAGPDR